MHVNKYNSEGYYDPTAYEAITAVLAEESKAKQEQQKYRPKVFICSPFAGDSEENIINARSYCIFAVNAGYIPFAPHLLFPQFLNDNDPEQRKLGLLMGKVFLDGCKELWVFGHRDAAPNSLKFDKDRYMSFYTDACHKIDNYYISSGMEEEINRAKKRNITIRYFNNACKEVEPWDSQKN